MAHPNLARQSHQLCYSTGFATLVCRHVGSDSFRPQHATVSCAGNVESMLGTHCIFFIFLFLPSSILPWYKNNNVVVFKSFVRCTSYFCTSQYSCKFWGAWPPCTSTSSDTIMILSFYVNILFFPHNFPMSYYTSQCYTTTRSIPYNTKLNHSSIVPYTVFL